jgi:hypothetical protein
MQRALSSTRTRAAALSSGTTTKFRSGAGLGQQLRFAHKASIRAIESPWTGLIGEARI